MRLYEESGSTGETPLAFFRRVDLTVVKAALVGLDRLSADAATEEDFVDLGEDAAFNPEVQEGECTA